MVAVSLVPCRQQGPSSVGGMGMSDQVDPAGLVPSLTKVVCAAVSFCSVPFGKTMACSSCTKSRGCAWKHASVSGDDTGQSRHSQ